MPLIVIGITIPAQAASRLYYVRMVTKQENYIFDDISNKWVKSADYHRQYRHTDSSQPKDKIPTTLPVISKQAQTLLDWLYKRNKQIISLTEIYKCVVPISLRHAQIIRELMNELSKLGYAAPASTSIIYSGYKTKVGWELFLGQGYPVSLAS